MHSHIQFHYLLYRMYISCRTAIKYNILVNCIDNIVNKVNIVKMPGC